MGPQCVGSSFDSPSLAIVRYRPERVRVVDYYEENPMGTYRGLVFAIVFNLLLAMTGFGGWMLWKTLH